MEEILASIRKIIAEDQKALEVRAGEGVTAPLTIAGPAEPSAAAATADNADQDDDDVLDLGPPARAGALPAEEHPLMPPLRSAAPQASVSAPPQPGAGLLSDSSAQATGAAFQSLANAVFTQNARTMDDLVKEMLRPMLKAWLDENLPAMVERLVRAEIERVARGGR
jgi:cell pole-organizing protein PopZ